MVYIFFYYVIGLIALLKFISFSSVICVVVCVAKFNGFFFFILQIGNPNSREKNYLFKVTPANPLQIWGQDSDFLSLGLKLRHTLPLPLSLALDMTDNTYEATEPNLLNIYKVLHRGRLHRCMTHTVT